MLALFKIWIQIWVFIQVQIEIWIRVLALIWESVTSSIVWWWGLFGGFLSPCSLLCRELHWLVSSGMSVICSGFPNQTGCCSDPPMGGISDGAWAREKMFFCTWMPHSVWKTFGGYFYQFCLCTRPQFLFPYRWGSMLGIGLIYPSRGIFFLWVGQLVCMGGNSFCHKVLRSQDLYSSKGLQFSFRIFPQFLFYILRDSRLFVHPF